jgi:nicotinate-nucleotide--dimethylbenzimidazole phosphoribosyltransferase
MSFTPPILPALDSKLALRLRACVDGKAKPLGSLGRMEDLAVQIGLIQNTETPRVEVVETYVFAGDHGLNAEGVSAYPSAVTAAVVATFLAGRANVNALSEACGVAVAVVDSGVDADLPAHPPPDRCQSPAWIAQCCDGVSAHSIRGRIGAHTRG